MESYVKNVFLKPESNLSESKNLDESNQSTQLQRTIAHEKGLINVEDFDHLSKIIEVYSKALMHETRKKHIKERQKVYQEEKDLNKY